MELFMTYSKTTFCECNEHMFELPYFERSLCRLMCKMLNLSLTWLQWPLHAWNVISKHEFKTQLNFESFPKCRISKVKIKPLLGLHQQHSKAFTENNKNTKISNNNNNFFNQNIWVKSDSWISGWALLFGWHEVKFVFNFRHSWSNEVVRKVYDYLLLGLYYRPSMRALYFSLATHVFFSWPFLLLSLSACCAVLKSALQSRWNFNEGKRVNTASSSKSI